MGLCHPPRRRCRPNPQLLALGWSSSSCSKYLGRKPGDGFIYKNTYAHAYLFQKGINLKRSVLKSSKQLLEEEKICRKPREGAWATKLTASSSPTWHSWACPAPCCSGPGQVAGPCPLLGSPVLGRQAQALCRSSHARLAEPRRAHPRPREGGQKKQSPHIERGA